MSDRTEPCSRWCPFQPCDTCPYKGGTWGSTDEQTEPKPSRKERGNGDSTERLRPA